MSQADQFQPECLAPDDWVAQVEGKATGSAVWRDSSWGNNAAPSWELAQADLVLAEAFYYTTGNAERYTEHFDGQPYISVVMFDEVENPTVAFEASPQDFLTILISAAARPEVAATALLKAAEGAPSPRIYWDRDI
jgi:hypothetical protein